MFKKCHSKLTQRLYERLNIGKLFSKTEVQAANLHLNIYRQIVFSD